MGSFGIRTLVAVVLMGSFGIEPMRAGEVLPVRKPIRVLLVTGGPFHDYKKQEKILVAGMTSRANIEWTVVNEEKNETGYFYCNGWSGEPLRFCG